MLSIGGGKLLKKHIINILGDEKEMSNSIRKTNGDPEKFHLI